MERHFRGFSIQYIPRDDNNDTDKLAKAVARNHLMPPDVFFEIIKEPSKMEDSKAMASPMSMTTTLDVDEEGGHMDQKKYRSMIGSLMYLTAVGELGKNLSPLKR
jgi:hypothetical protein